MNVTKYIKDAWNTNMIKINSFAEGPLAHMNINDIKTNIQPIVNSLLNSLINGNFDIFNAIVLNVVTNTIFDKVKTNKIQTAQICDLNNNCIDSSILISTIKKLNNLRTN